MKYNSDIKYDSWVSLSINVYHSLISLVMEKKKMYLCYFLCLSPQTTQALEASWDNDVIVLHSCGISPLITNCHSLTIPHLPCQTDNSPGPGSRMTLDPNNQSFASQLFTSPVTSLQWVNQETCQQKAIWYQNVHLQVLNRCCTNNLIPCKSFMMTAERKRGRERIKGAADGWRRIGEGVSESLGHTCKYMRSGVISSNTEYSLSVNFSLFSQAAVGGRPMYTYT